MAKAPVTGGDLSLLEGVATHREFGESCVDSCCLPHPEWFGVGGQVSASDADLARRALRKTADPRLLALALRVLGPVAEVADRVLLAPRIDDRRPGGSLPDVFISQAAMRCYPITWRPVTVGSEALRALSRIHATNFADAEAYRKWATGHADPEATFDHWYARLSRQTPPEPELVRGLRRREPLLVARVLSAYCEGDERCGISSGELAGLLEGAVGGDRALRWLGRQERFPEWERSEIHHRVMASVLRHGELLFTDTHHSRLEALLGDKEIPSYLRARLAVLLGRLRPSAREALWAAALRDLEGGREQVLREAASRAPEAWRGPLLRWFYGDAVPDVPSARDCAEAILRGLAEAAPAGAVTFKTLVMQRSVPLEDEPVIMALATAARAHGCKGIQEPWTLRTHGLKGASEGQREEERRRASLARAHMITRVRACAAAMATRP